MTGRGARMGKAVHKESLGADLVHRVNGGVFNLDIIKYVIQLIEC